MKTRESNMPEEERWNAFFDSDFILTALGLDPNSQWVVDVGGGCGTFSIPAAGGAPPPVFADSPAPTARWRERRLRRHMLLQARPCRSLSGCPDDVGCLPFLYAAA